MEGGLQGYKGTGQSFYLVNMVWVHSKTYFLLFITNCTAQGELFLPLPTKHPPWDGTMLATRVSIYAVDIIWTKPDQISKTTIAKNSSLHMEIVSMKDVFSNLELYYYASGFQDLLLVKVTSLKHVWHLLLKCISVLFFHTEDWKHSVRRLVDFTCLNSNACLVDETHYTDRCELLRWGQDGHMQIKVSFGPWAKFLNGAL